MGAFSIINKWIRMLRGKSVLHVRQGLGRVYSKETVKGYYNDFTGKVAHKEALLDESGLVYNITNEGNKVFFSIAIFQYGLGAYDLYMMSGQIKYRESFMRATEWAVHNQEKNGAWDTFKIIGSSTPFSSMAQGEGASLLLRAYLETGDRKYYHAAQNAIEFMCKSIAEGGCAEYEGDSLRFKEYLEKPVVLNGWIFSIWGLYDFCKVSHNRDYDELLTRTIQTLERDLRQFDCKYWSKYDMNNTIASPFYHQLHVAQLQVMNDLFSSEKFLSYANRWNKYQENVLFFLMAFLRKAYQKLTEKHRGRIVIVR